MPLTKTLFHKNRSSLILGDPNFRTISKNVIRLKWNSVNKTKHNQNVWYREQSKTENFKYKSNAERVECLKCIKL
jgi:hypothetical protein